MADVKPRSGRESAMKTQWHVATAAEAFAAAQFARCGWDVLVQYGANLPEYDFVATNGDHMLKVSVKGSQDGSWGLTQSFIENADYHGAADKWLAKHGRKTVFCLVQFKGTTLDTMPRMYLAMPEEIAGALTRAGRGVAPRFSTRSTNGPRGPKLRARPMRYQTRGSLLNTACKRLRRRPRGVIDAPRAAGRVRQDAGALPLLW
jgi:Holliday junction resolvase-like predicted endonuclease